MAIGIIGGTGVYDPALLEQAEQVKIHTPFGSPSDLVVVGKYNGIDVVFIPRHGSKHTISPSCVNYRANIWAMKELGVTHILAPAAVGSLREKIKPGDIVFPDQIIDRTYGRKVSFYEGSKVCHVSFAHPFCEKLRKVLIKAAKEAKIRAHESGTCVVIEGPRFSTKAESNLFRSWGCDIINMTMYPECVLAREAQICYASIAMVTDWDCWKERIVDTKTVLETMRANVAKVKQIISAAIPKIEVDGDCPCRHALEGAFV